MSHGAADSQDWRPAALASLKARAETGDPKAIRLLLEMGESITHPPAAELEILAMARVLYPYQVSEEPGDSAEWSRLRLRVAILEAQLVHHEQLERQARELSRQVELYQQDREHWTCPACGAKPQ